VVAIGSLEMVGAAMKRGWRPRLFDEEDELSSFRKKENEEREK
jgi:hypothetical protein